LTRDVPPKLDFWAEPLKLQGDWPQAIYDFFSPFQIPTKTEGDRVDEELKRLGYPLRMPSYVLEVGGGPSEYLGGKEIEAVRLNAEQYNRYLEISRKEIKSNGETLKDRLKSVIIADSYKNKPEEQKMYIIKEVIQAYQQTAKAVLLKEYPDLAAQAKASKLGKKGYEPTGQLKAVGGGYGQ
jgi:hypothetical protein